MGNSGEFPDQEPAATPPPQVTTPSFLASVRRLRELDPSTLTAAEVRKAVQALRPVRGWVDRLDGQLRLRANDLEQAPQPSPEPDAGAPDPSASGQPQDDDQSDTAQSDDVQIGSETVDKDSGIGAREGRRRDARSKVLALFPDLGPLLEAGLISTEHLDAIVGALASMDRAIAARIVDYSETICDEAKRHPAEVLRRALGRIAQQIATDLGIERREQQKRATRLRHWMDGATGMGRIHGELDPDSYQLFIAMLENEVNRQLRDRGDLHPDRHRAMCLLDLMASGAEESECVGSPRPSLSLDVVIDAHTLIHGPHSKSICEYADGTPAQIADIIAAACTAELHPVLIAGGTLPLSVGRKVRMATPGQSRALRVIYATCAIPGCETSVTHCQIHHIVPWERGGLTDLSNLLPLCSRHHHLCHDERWVLHLDPDRTLTVTAPDGTVQRATPDRWPRPGPLSSAAA